MYRKSSKGWLKHSDFILLDLISLQVAFILAYFFRHGLHNPYSNSVYLDVALFILLVDTVVMFFTDTLKNVLKRGYYQEFAATVKHAVIVELLVALYLFVVQEGEIFSRIVLFTMGVLYAFITYAVRVLWKCVLGKQMRDGGNRSLLIVTTKDVATTVVDNIKDYNYEMFNIIGLAILDCDMTGEMINGIPVVSNNDTVMDYVCREWVDEVFVMVSQKYSLPQDLINQFVETGVVVHLNLAKASETKGRKQLVERVGKYTVLTTSVNYATAKQAFYKRTLDIVGSLVGCLITGIIFIFVAPIIYIQSPGPIFFKQTRIGKNGKKFTMYKFRSMYMDAEERKKELMNQNRVKDGMMFKVDFDTRVIGNKILPNGKKKTGIGNFMRVTSLDEFPQFFNVLKGDMSLVGTRPPTVDEWEKYELHHRARLATKPGITGLWQISGRSDITDFEEVVKLDLQYISEWNIGLDIKILFMTVLAVLGRKGSM